LSRRRFVQGTAAFGAGLACSGGCGENLLATKRTDGGKSSPSLVKAFCVSYNGYAWYPSKVAPVTPGLKCPDFLGEMVRRGHDAGMKVMGYFTLGANPYWEKRHPDKVHDKDADFIKIPMTLEYLDYFCRSVEDALTQTGIDGFMIDWVRPTRHERWLDCEKEMYRQLMGEPFPGSEVLPADVVVEFDRRALARAWKHIRWTVRGTRPAIIWTNHPIIEKEYPIWDGHPVLAEVDWILNEAPDIEHLKWLRQRVGPKALIVQNLCGWKGHDASVWKELDLAGLGLYGFAKADPKTTLPGAEKPRNLKNIEILREAYRTL